MFSDFVVILIFKLLNYVQIGFLRGGYAAEECAYNRIGVVAGHYLYGAMKS